MQEVYIDEEINRYFNGGMSDFSIDCGMRTEGRRTEHADSKWSVERSDREPDYRQSVRNR